MTSLPSYLEQPAYLYKLNKVRQGLTSRANVDYWSLLKILDKRDQVISLAPNEVQRRFLKERTKRNLILKARQQGISTIIQADHFVTGISQTARIATLAHDDTTTQKLRRMAHFYWQSLPDDARPPRGLDNATTTTYPNTQSEVLIATAGNIHAGRGGTYTRFHGSEVAFWKDAQSVMAGVLQGVPEDGIVDLESTPNGAQGYFYELCMEALDGNDQWKLFFFPWWLDSGYQLSLDEGETLTYTDEERELVRLHSLTPEQIKWRRKKQRELGRLFPQEYPEDPRTCFLASGVGYFSDIRDLEGAFTAPVNAEYNPSHRYIAAMDFGQQQDYSVVSVMDATTLQEVELWRVNRIPWGDIRQRALETCKKWHVESFHPERNSMGGTNIEELHKEFARAGCHTLITPFETTAQTKPAMVTAFHWALDEGGLKLLPDPAGKQEIYGYTATQLPSGAWKYEGLPHDDTVMARIGAWNAIVLGGVSMGRAVAKWG
jgi:hypothetical protein